MCVHTLLGSRSSAPASAPSLPRSVALEQLSGRVEIVRPSELAIVRFLGSGGSGDVFQAKWHGTDVAVKCLQTSPGEDEMAVLDELLAQSRLLCRLRHANIARLYAIVIPDHLLDQATGKAAAVPPPSLPRPSPSALHPVTDAEAVAAAAAAADPGHAHGVSPPPSPSSVPSSILLSEYEPSNGAHEGMSLYGSFTVSAITPSAILSRASTHQGGMGSTGSVGGVGGGGGSGGCGGDGGGTVPPSPSPHPVIFPGGGGGSGAPSPSPGAAADLEKLAEVPSATAVTAAPAEADTEVLEQRAPHLVPPVSVFLGFAAPFTTGGDNSAAGGDDDELKDDEQGDARSGSGGDGGVFSRAVTPTILFSGLQRSRRLPYIRARSSLGVSTVDEPQSPSATGVTAAVVAAAAVPAAATLHQQQRLTNSNGSSNGDSSGTSASLAPPATDTAAGAGAAGGKKPQGDAAVAVVAAQPVVGEEVAVSGDAASTANSRACSSSGSSSKRGGHGLTRQGAEEKEATQVEDVAGGLGAAGGGATGSDVSGDGDGGGGILHHHDHADQGHRLHDHKHRHHNHPHHPNHHHHHHHSDHVRFSLPPLEPYERPSSASLEGPHVTVTVPGRTAGFARYTYHHQQQQQRRGEEEEAGGGGTLGARITHWGSASNGGGYVSSSSDEYERHDSALGLFGGGGTDGGSTGRAGGGGAGGFSRYRMERFGGVGASGSATHSSGASGVGAGESSSGSGMGGVGSSGSDADSDMLYSTAHGDVMDALYYTARHQPWTTPSEAEEDPSAGSETTTTASVAVGSVSPGGTGNANRLPHPSPPQPPLLPAPTHGSFLSPFAPLSQRQLTIRAASLESQLQALLGAGDGTPSLAPEEPPDAGAAATAERPLFPQRTRGASDGGLGGNGGISWTARRIAHEQEGQQPPRQEQQREKPSPSACRGRGQVAAAAVLPPPQQQQQQQQQQGEGANVQATVVYNAGGEDGKRQQQSLQPPGGATATSQPVSSHSPNEIPTFSGIPSEIAAAAVPSTATAPLATMVPSLSPRRYGDPAAPPLAVFPPSPLSRRSSSTLLRSASGALVRRLGSKALLAAASSVMAEGSTGGGTSAGTEAAELENSRLVACHSIPGPALMSEYLTGNSIRSALRRHSDVVKSPLARIKVALDAAQGMEYLHSRGVVHLNLKTGNLLVGFSEKQPACKVCDFGLRRPTVLAAVAMAWMGTPLPRPSPSPSLPLPLPLPATSSSSPGFEEGGGTTTPTMTTPTTSTTPGGGVMPASSISSFHLAPLQPPYPPQSPSQHQLLSSGQDHQREQQQQQQQSQQELRRQQQQQHQQQLRSQQLLPGGGQPHQAPLALLARSLPWTAPEVLRTPHEVTEKADVYSYGMIMWSLWTRAEPWAGADMRTLLAAVMSGGEPRPPVPGDPNWPPSEARPPELAPGWSTLMRRCWSTDPRDRPTFKEVLERMRAIFLEVKRQRRAATAAAAAAATTPSTMPPATGAI